MSILDRLGSVIKSYFSDDDDAEAFPTGRRRQTDPDLEAAFEELDDFLSGTPPKHRPAPAPTVPPELQGAFAELGVPVGASPETCKEAYKRLLKIHHPDRHAGHPGDMKKATEKTARINAAYERITSWQRTTT